MVVVTKKTSRPRAKSNKTIDTAPIRMKTWSEFREYLATHLTPVRRGPKGQPIYAQKDLESLNILPPDQE